MTSSSAKHAEAKKITSESCEQVNVAPAELVKANSPNVPSVPHRTQRTEIVRMAEGTDGMLELPMEVAGVDGMAMLDGKPAMRVCGVDKGDNSAWKFAETPASAPMYMMKIVSTMKTSETT